MCVFDSRQLHVVLQTHSRHRQIVAKLTLEIYHTITRDIDLLQNAQQLLLIKRQTVPTGPERVGEKKTGKKNNKNETCGKDKRRKRQTSLLDLECREVDTELG